MAWIAVSKVSLDVSFDGSKAKNVDLEKNVVWKAGHGAPKDFQYIRPEVTYLYLDIDTGNIYVLA